VLGTLLFAGTVLVPPARGVLDRVEVELFVLVEVFVGAGLDVVPPVEPIEPLLPPLPPEVVPVTVKIPPVIVWRILLAPPSVTAEQVELLVPVQMLWNEMFPLPAFVARKVRVATVWTPVIAAVAPAPKLTVPVPRTGDGKALKAESPTKFT